jgi:glycosyltransferase involved in cell wall biosynthesis
VKATVVIPTYRRSERLRQLLECLATQRGDALAQVIVCDDGSSDDTGDVARSFAGRIPVVYCWQEDLGFRAGQARNLGITRAEGDVLIFVDDDVLVASDFVEEHVGAHAAQPLPSIVIGYRHRTLVPPRGAPTQDEIARCEPDDRAAVLGSDGTPVSEHPRPWVYVYSCNFSARRGSPELFFEEGFHGWGMEDIELGYRLWKRARMPIVAAPRARVLHVEDVQPRDPFRCEERSIAPSYDTYVRNAVFFMDRADDPEVTDWVRRDLRWYVKEEASGRWVKNGYANDVDAVIARCRAELAEMRAERPRRTSSCPAPARMEEERTA